MGKKLHIFTGLEAEENNVELNLKCELRLEMPPNARRVFAIKINLFRTLYFNGTCGSFEEESR